MNIVASVLLRLLAVLVAIRLLIKLVSMISTNTTEEKKSSSQEKEFSLDSVPITFTDKKMQGHGFYTATFIVNNQTKHISTFFPSTWSKMQVANAVNDASEELFSQGRHTRSVPNKDGIHIVHGFTKEGIKIEFYVRPDGESLLIDRAYPIFK